jgi:nitrite reductase [NAD(P)H] small subunit
MTRESRWIRVTQCENIPLREGRAVHVEGKELALFNLGERFLAIENRCPHRGGPLADGIVSGNMVVCPLHAWRVCLDDGRVAKPADQKACLSTYSTKVEDGVVCIQLQRPETFDEAHLAASSACMGEPAHGPDLELESTAG